jgi:hypothetical protein
LATKEDIALKLFLNGRSVVTFNRGIKADQCTHKVANSRFLDVFLAKQTPFMVSFLSDGFTWQTNAAVNMAGFTLDYFETAC